MGFNFRNKGGRTYRSWKQWSEGDFIIGTYQESYEDQFGNECYEVKIIETDFAEEKDNLDEGVTLGVNSCGALKNKFKDVPVGSTVRIEFLGTGVVEKGPMKGKDFNNVGLGVDESTATGGVVKNAVKAQSKLDKESEESGDGYDL